ncbi:site-specific integrase [uncultured Amphritea sp.]|uniref:tyrosine-type recombinase/integrase n=1 Tax=uncultured Amphritea sp. TaxID=981605 RepID=UPI0025EBAC87|nr:site-specific integrase [uncultured Amphritea sp.]
MSRRLFFKVGKNWVGEFPHDHETGFVRDRRGIRRKLISIEALELIPKDQQAGRLVRLYHAKEYEIRNATAKQKELKKQKRRDRLKMTVRQGVKLWLSEIERSSSLETHKSYAQSLNLYFDAVGNHLLMDFDREYNMRFFNALSERPGKNGQIVAKATQNKHMRHLQAFLNWAHDNELIERQFNLKRAAAPRKDMDTLDLSALIKIREYLDQRIESAETNKEKRHTLNLIRAFKLATNSLLRLGAIWSLRLDHIDLKNRIIRIRNNDELNWKNKKNKWPNKPINDALYEFLKEDLAQRPASHKYFLDNGLGQPWYKNINSLSTAMKAVYIANGLDNIKPFHHGFRATMITELLLRGEDPYCVQQLADHDSVQTTLLYLNTRKVSQAKAANAIPAI